MPDTGRQRRDRGEHAQHQERIDVAAGEHRDHRRLELPRILHDGRDGRRARWLDDELGSLQTQQQRPGQRLLDDRQDVIDVVAHERKGRSPGRPTAMPSAIVAHARKPSGVRP